MLGSPIRTPPDQRFVANSPGLIAGSYVLHRLLMPRHPPCALHSLSHKHSTKTTNVACKFATKTGATHHPPPGEETMRLARVTPKDARVHYPLDNTPAHQHPIRRQPSPTPGRRRPPHQTSRQGRRSVIPQSPTVCQRPSPRSADPQVPRPPDQPAGSTEETHAQERAFIDDSTSEQHHRPHHGWRETSWLTDSLERR